MSLTAIQTKNAKPGRHADGKGLYLLVKSDKDDKTKATSRSWVLRVQFQGRRRDFGLGSLDLVSLAEARDKAREWRKLAKQGIDPSLEARKLLEIAPTFEQVAREYHDTIKAGWKNDKHSAQWLSTLEAYAFPHFGARRVDVVDITDIRSALLPIWLKAPETARRVRQRIGVVLDYAFARKWRASEAPMRAAVKAFPKQPKKGHHSAMPYQEVPALMRQLEELGDSIGRLAVRFTILNCVRSGETRGAAWDEIDFERKQWNIPANRMKAGEAHSVPLSGPALDILAKMRAFYGGKPGELIFKGNGGKPLSDMTLTKALRDAGVEGATVHGMRSAFRDWGGEQTSFPAHWLEATLAHKIKDKVEAAYLRSQFLEQRRAVMDAWADYLQGRSRVVSLAAAS